MVADPLQLEMVRWRHDIHKHPEQALQEHRTASKIAELLRSFGFDQVVENYGGQSAVIGVLQNKGSRSIGLVAGTDGQAVLEDNDTLEYRSVYAHQMHALGHDGEVAMLLGAAKQLASSRNFRGKVVFIFCSASGRSFGSKNLIENGFFQDFPLEEIYQFQSFPGLPAGQIAVSAGPCMAALAELLIKIHGRGGYGAFPHRAINPIDAAAVLTHSLEQLVCDSVDPANPLIVGVHSFHAGDSFLFIPDTVELKGMVRYITVEIEKWLPGRINTLITKLSEAYSVQADVSYQMVCPVTTNSTQQARFARETAETLLGTDRIQEYQPVTMVAKDFAYFLQEVPGAVIYIGNGGFGLFHPQYDFNDEILLTGTKLWVHLVETFLNG